MSSDKNKLKFKEYFFSLPSLQQAGFFLWPSLANYLLTEEETCLLKEMKPSGIIFFKRNLASMDQAKNLITQLRDLIENKQDSFYKPLITSIDEEGGRVSRLPLENIRGKSALEYAMNQDLEGLQDQILNQCSAAKQIGINCLLAPVADILTEPKNAVMGDRCFGYDAQTVSKYVTLVNSILLNENIFSCAKHFPGHGNTLTDSHKELSVSLVTLEELKAREWLPFKTLIKENIPFIMAAHVLLPHVDAQNPATLSFKILTQQLRHELGFKGLILSDDLRMNAIALHYGYNKKQESSITEDLSVNDFSIKNSTQIVNTPDDSYLLKASIDALNAGCDILLSCQSIEKEVMIAQNIANHMNKDEVFRNQMVEKAWRIYLQLKPLQSGFH